MNRKADEPSKLPETLPDSKPDADEHDGLRILAHLIARHHLASIRDAGKTSPQPKPDRDRNCKPTLSGE